MARNNKNKDKPVRIDLSGEFSVHANQFVTEFFRKDRIPHPKRLESQLNKFLEQGFRDYFECIEKQRQFISKKDEIIEELKVKLESVD